MSDYPAPGPPQPPRPPVSPETAPLPPTAPPMPAAYAGATTPAPPAPERRSRTGLWVGLGVGAGVIGVAVVVSLFILAWSGSSVGASSPAAALDGMVKALQNKDIASVLSGLAPGELTGVDELWRETQTKTAALGGDVPKATGDVIVFEPRTVKWDVEELSANTAPPSPRST